MKQYLLLVTYESWNGNQWVEWDLFETADDARINRQAKVNASNNSSPESTKVVQSAVFEVLSVD